MEQSVEQIESLKGLQWGELSLGIASGLAGTLVPEMVVRVRRLLSRVKLTVSVMGTSDIAAALKAGDLDLALCFDLPTAGLQVLGRKQATLGAVVAPQHPLASRASVSLDECANYPFCVARAPLTLRLHLERAFESASIPFRPLVETDSVEMMRCLALTEPYITFLSPFDTYRERRAGLLVHVPVPRDLPYPETIVLAVRKKGASPLAARVGEVFRAVLDEAW